MRSFSARSVSVLMKAFRESEAGAAATCGLPPAMVGRGRFSMSAVCTSAKVRNIDSSSGRLMNFAKGVCIR